MNKEVVAAERAQSVRQSARAWRRRGFIGEDTLATIVSLYPDDRQRLGIGFRTLTYIFSGIGIFAAYGLFELFVGSQLGSKWNGVVLILWAGALAAATEFLRGPARRAQAGAESVTAHLCVVFAFSGAALFANFRGEISDGLILLALASSLCGVAAWRWGGLLFFVGAGIGGFGFLALMDQGRLLWIAASIPLLVACLRASRHEAMAPSYRRGAVVLAALSILALYFGVHIWTLDMTGNEPARLWPSNFMTTSGLPHEGLRTLSMLATALVPPGLIVIGWRRREPLLIHGGLLLLGVSIATIRLYRNVMPLSMALIFIGSFCLAIAFGIRRSLRSGIAGERDGFTADPLFDTNNRTEAIRSVVSMATFTPDAQAPTAPNAFEGGGGSFGGGGASGRF